MDLYTKAFAMTVVALFALALYWMLAPFWGALAWGISLAFLLMPLHTWLTRRLNGSPNASAGIITTLVPVALVVPLISLGLVFADQVADLSTRLKQEPLFFGGGLLAQLEQTPVIGHVAGWLRLHMSATTEQLQAWLDHGIEVLLQALAGKGGNFLLGAMNTFVHFLMMLFLLYFLLRDGRLMLGRVKRLVPMDAKRSDKLLKLIGDTVHAVIFGEVMTALAQGALVGIGCAIAGLSSAVVLGVLAATLAILPVGGAAIVWVPVVLYLAATAQWGWAIFMLVWGLCVSVADNMMRPLLVRRQAPVSILAVFVGVIGGVSAFGMIGIIIGPVVLTVIIALLRYVDAGMTEAALKGD